MKKKILAIALAVVILATAAVAATLAWFTDVEEDATTITLGNVKIDLDVPSTTFTNVAPGTEEINTYSFTAAVTNVGANEAWVRVKVYVPTDVANVIHLLDTNGNTIAPSDDTFEIEDVEYMMYTFTNADLLANGDAAYSPVSGFYLDKDVDCDENGKYFYQKTALTALDDGVNFVVQAEAMQAKGFESNSTTAWTQFAAQYPNGYDVETMTEAADLS